MNGSWSVFAYRWEYADFDYHKTYYYQNACSSCINNFWSSIDITTGGTAPYPSTFLYSSSPSDFFTGAIDMSNWYWTAKTAGDCCGITAEVKP